MTEDSGKPAPCVSVTAGIFNVLSAALGRVRTIKFRHNRRHIKKKKKKLLIQCKLAPQVESTESIHDTQILYKACIHKHDVSKTEKYEWPP